MKKSEYLYLDHAATTPMREIAIKAFIDAEHEGFANSSGGHNLSRKAKNILEESREIISSIFEVAPNFTPLKLNTLLYILFTYCDNVV